MRLQLSKGSGSFPISVPEDPRHRDRGVVVEQQRHAAEERKASYMAIAKGLGCLRRIGLDEERVRVRQRIAK